MEDTLPSRDKRGVSRDLLERTPMPAMSRQTRQQDRRLIPLASGIR
jgi:hypothetical protein